ncbi:MAG: TonB-dependent receptor [Gammaproteobacteria bacterium]|nr:TonB-dependent receptor [Gammaproteobacteria bacterium]
MSLYKHPVITTSVACFSILMLQPAFAAALDEIVVTAQKREQNLQDVPLSVTAVSGRKMQQMLLNDMTAVAAYVPGLSIDVSDDTNIHMRGLGSGDNEGFEQSVGMYIDGVYMSRGRQYRSALVDVNRVEVVKGPQGILFGQNTIAGAISVVTNRPTDTFEASASATVGIEYGDDQITGIISGPLTEKIKGRFVVNAHQMDGYLENTNATTNVEGAPGDVPQDDDHTLRGSLDIAVNENVNMFIKAELGSYERLNSTTQMTVNGNFTPTASWGNLFQLADPTHETTLDTTVHSGSDNADKQYKEFDTTDTQNLVFSLDHALKDGLVMTYVTGYTDYDYQNAKDVDFTPLPLIFRERQQAFDQLSQEIRITSPAGENIEYIGGVYYQQDNLDSHVRSDLHGKTLGILNSQFNFLTASIINNFEQDGTTAAVFAQGSIKLPANTKLTLGGRYSSVRKEVSKNQYIANYGTETENVLLQTPMLGLGFDKHSFTQSRTDTEFTPSVNFQWEPDATAMLYAGVSTGFKAGGFNEDQESANPAFNPDYRDEFAYDPETSASLELGSKFNLNDGATRLNIALFYTQFENLQTSTLVGTNFVVSNAAEATTTGFEIDTQWLVTESLEAGGSVAYVKAEFDKFNNAPCTSPVAAAYLAGRCTITGTSPLDIPIGSTDLSGQTLPFAPEWTANVYARYIIPMNDLNWTIQGDANYTDAYFFEADLDPLDKQDAYTKYDLRLALGHADGIWEAALVGKNITDKITAVAGGDVPFLSDISSGEAPHYVWTAPGRNYLVNFTYRFK